MAWIRMGSLTTATNTAAVSVTGLPSAPKGIILWVAGTSPGQVRPSFSIGWCDGALNQASTTRRTTLSTGTSDELQLCSNTVAVAMYNGFTLVNLSVTAITSDGFTITPSFSPGVARVISYFAFGGAGVATKVSSFSGGSGPRNESGLTFTPTGILGFFSAVGGGVAWNSTLAGAHTAILTFDGSTRRSHWNVAQNAQATTATRSAARNGNGFAASNNAITFATDPQVTFTSLNASGYTWSQSSASTMLSSWFAFTGVSMKILETVVPGATGNVALTGAGFQPNAAMNFISPVSTTNDASIANGDHFGIGATRAAAYEAAAAVSENGLVGSSDANAFRSSTNFVYSINRTGAATFATRDAATLVSYDADGLTLNFNTVGGTAGLITVLAFFSDEINPTGIRRKYTLDSGWDQIDWSLHEDENVITQGYPKVSGSSPPGVSGGGLDDFYWRNRRRMR